MSARQFVFLVAAVLTFGALMAGCGSDTVAPAGNTEALFPPSNVTVAQLASGDVKIAWDPVINSNLQGYNVYRREIGVSSAQKLTSAPITATQYLDTSPDWQKQYEYRVTSVGTKGNESTPIVMSIQLHAPDLRGRGKPFEQ